MRPAQRKSLYAIAAAVTALLAVYGFIDAEKISYWEALAAAIFGVAFYHTDTDYNEEVTND